MRPAMAVLGVLLGTAAGHAQTDPVLTRVEITAPLGTLAQPFRTNRELLSIEFTSDAAGGIFFATSEGVDVPMSLFLGDGGSGRVGAGFTTEGFHQVRVRVSNSSFGNPPAPLSAVSDPTVIVLDRTPPTLTINQIRLGPDRPLEPYDARRVYRTNADSVQLVGFVNDGPGGVRSETITIEADGVIARASVNAGPSGIFDLVVDISQEPEGSIDLRLVANDNVVSARDGNRSEVPVGLR